MSGVTTGAFYALVALGIVIVYKATSVMNFAHGELFMFAGYAGYCTSWPVFELPSLLLAVAGGFVVGILTERVAYRSSKTVSSASCWPPSARFVLKGIARYIWGGKGDYLAFPPIMSPEPILFGNIMIMSQQLVVLLAIVVMLRLAVFFRHTRAGKMMQATASNPKAAMLVGIRIDRIYMFTFAVGAAVAGAAACSWRP